MTGRDDTDRRIATWFGDETGRVPERTLDVAMAHAHAHPRRRDPLAFLRRDPMGRGLGDTLFVPVPLLAAVGLIVAAVIGGAIAGGFLDRPAPVVPAPPSVGPSPVLTSGPTPALFSVDLVEVSGADATIDITDHSATVVAAESGQPRDGGSVAEGVDVRLDPADANRIVLTWTGSPCDTTHTLEIVADGRSATLSRPSCSGDAIPRDLQLRLTFAEQVDPTSFEVSLVTE